MAIGLMRAAWLATASLALAPTALAQAPATAPLAEDDEIIVTAQKREERLQDVPISINVQSGDTLEKAGIDTFFALQARVPNLVINDTPANASISIRGVGTTGNTLSFEQSVSLFVDGIYGGRNRQFMQPFFDVERIEVLRGPQGALFGRNTSAGAINVITRRPSRDFEARASVDYETVRSSTFLELAAGGPVSDTLAARFAVRYAHVNGWLDNTTLNRTEPDRDDILARASLLWEPSERIRVYGKVEYGSADIVGAGFEFVPAGTRPDYRVDHDDSYAPLKDRSEALNGTVQVDIGLGEHVLTSLTGYSRYDYDQAFNIQARRPVRLVVANSEVFEQWSQELRLVSPANRRLRYIIGGYVEGSSSDILRITFVDIPPPPALNNRNTRRFVQDVDVLAFFGQADFDLSERLTLSAGLRWTRIQKVGGTSGINQTFLPPTGATSIISPRVPLDGDLDETNLAPSASITWRATDWANLYFRYAEGSKGGAFSETATFIKDFELEQETARAYEAGAKVDIRPLRGFVNVALYWTNYRNLQKSSLDVVNAVFVTTNAAGARVRGVEVESAFRPADWLRVGASVAFLDAIYTSYPNGPCAFPRHTIPACQEDRTGDRLQNSPKWSGSLYADVEAPLNDRLRAFGNWTTSFRTDTNYQDILHPLEVQEGFSKSDVRAGIGGADGQWELALLVRNLFDKRTSGQIFQTFAVGTQPNDRVHLPDPRRSFTIQGRVRF